MITEKVDFCSKHGFIDCGICAAHEIARSPETSQPEVLSMVRQLREMANWDRVLTSDAALFRRAANFMENSQHRESLSEVGARALSVRPITVAVRPRTQSDYEKLETLKKLMELEHVEVVLVQPDQSQPYAPQQADGL